MFPFMGRIQVPVPTLIIIHTDIVNFIRLVDFGQHENSYAPRQSPFIFPGLFLYVLHK